MRTFMGKAAAVVGVLLVALQVQVQAEILPADARTNQRISIFRNVSGSTQSSQTAYILQDDDSDNNKGDGIIHRLPASPEFRAVRGSCRRHPSSAVFRSY